MRTYTVNTEGDNVDWANFHGYHAYYANGVTAIEIPAQDENDAREIVNEDLDLYVLYVFE